MGCKLIKRFLKEYVISEWRFIAIVVACTIISSICTVATAKFVKPIIDDVFVSKNIAMLSKVALMFLSVSLFRGLSDYLKSITLERLWQGIVRKLQLKLYAHLIDADLALFSSSPCGNIVSRLTNDIGILRNIVSITISELCNDLFVTIGMLCMIILQDPYFSILVVGGFSTMVLPTLRIGKKVRNLSTSAQIIFGSWISFLMQSFQGIRLIKSYNMEAYENARAKAISDDIYNLAMKSVRTGALVHPIIEALSGLAVAAVVFIGGWLVIHGYRTPGTLLSLLTAIIMVYKPVKNLANANTALQQGIAAAKRMYELIDITPTITCDNNAKDIAVLDGKIEFKGVTFQYVNGQNIIENFNLSIPAKKVVALVGHSGSGKSTLINLIMRFYDVQSGQIMIDGQNIKNVTLNSLRHSISLVSQDVILFNDTIYNNIAFGDTTASEDDIIRAAKLANAYDFIMKFQHNFHTEVGDNGHLLSGGQRQRVSIARAILKNAPILLLDEATSALDAESERDIQKAMGKLIKDKTTIIIAHRLSTILNADTIVVLDDGKIIEQGNHPELMALNGHYAKLYNMQQFENK